MTPPSPRCALLPLVLLVGCSRPSETPVAQETWSPPTVAPSSSATAHAAATPDAPELEIDPLRTLSKVVCTHQAKEPELVEVMFPDPDRRLTVEGTLRVDYAEGRESLATVEVRNGDGGGFSLVGVVSHPLYLAPGASLDGLMTPSSRTPLAVQRAGATFELRNPGSPHIDALPPLPSLRDKDPLAPQPMKRLATDVRVACSVLSLAPGAAVEEVKGPLALDVRSGVGLRETANGDAKVYFYAGDRNGAAAIGPGGRMPAPALEPRFAGPTVEIQQRSGKSVRVRFDVDDQRVLAWVDAALVGKRTAPQKSEQRAPVPAPPAPALPTALRVVTCRTPIALLMRGWEHPRRVGTLDPKTSIAVLEEPKNGLVRVGLDGVTGDGAELFVASRDLAGCEEKAR